MEYGHDYNNEQDDADWHAHNETKFGLSFEDVLSYTVAWVDTQELENIIWMDCEHIKKRLNDNGAWTGAVWRGMPIEETYPDEWFVYAKARFGADPEDRFYVRRPAGLVRNEEQQYIERERSWRSGKHWMGIPI